jgi:predicted N-acetyltransferase YhbS
MKLRVVLEPSDEVCKWEGVPGEAFMVLILDQGSMEGTSGIAQYRDEFGVAM